VARAALDAALAADADAAAIHPGAWNIFIMP
jgi:hypothetical protein